MKSPSIPQHLIDEYRVWLSATNNAHAPARAGHPEPLRDNWRDSWKHPRGVSDNWFDRTGYCHAKLRLRLQFAGMMPRPVS